MTTSRHDMRHGRQGGRVVDYRTKAEQADLDDERRRRGVSAPVFTSLADARARADQLGGRVVPVPDSSLFAVFLPGTSPGDLPAWFPAPTARAGDPATSHEAAQRAAGRAAGDRALVLRIHQQWTSGLTDFELADLADRQQTSLGVRRNELVHAGLICDSGHKRPSPSGTPSIVWVITPEGRAVDTGRPIDLERGAA